MSDLIEIIEYFEEKDEDQDELYVTHSSDNELYIRVADHLDESVASFILGDNDKDRNKAKQLLVVLKSYINKHA